MKEVKACLVPRTCTGKKIVAGEPKSNKVEELEE